MSLSAVQSRPAVWITRAEPGASATADRVVALKLEPIVGPLLTFQPLEAELAPALGEALAFTSINGVTRAAALTPLRRMRVFAVGDATAEAARAAGFSDVVSARGDVEALSRLIVQSPSQGRVLHPCARQTAGDLVGALRAGGVEARNIAVYETVAATALPAPVVDALESGRLRAILLHSPKAAQTAAHLLRGRTAALHKVIAIGLSPACAAPLATIGLQASISAPEPTEDALLNLLTELTARDRDG